jgi:ATP-dependent Zn protease
VFALLIVAVIAVLFLPPLLQHKQVKSLPYKTFLSDVTSHQIKTITINNSTGVITGNFRSTFNGGEGYTVSGGTPPPQADVDLMRHNVPTASDFQYTTPTVGFLGQWLPTIVILVLFVGVFFWISRRAQAR